MKETKKFILGTAILVLLPFLAYAATGSGLTTANFLKINPDPRIVAMGEGSIAELSQFPSIAVNNPAGLLGVNRPKLSLHYLMLVEDMKYSLGSFAIPTNYGNIGTSIMYLSYGDIQGYDVNFNKISIPASYDLGVVLTYAMPVKTTVPVYREYGAVGVNLKLLHSQLAEYSAESVALDLGSVFKMPFVNGLTAGFAYKNLGSGMKFVKETSPLPTSLNFGLGYKNRELMSLATVLDFESSDKGPFSSSAGFSLSPVYFLTLCAGYKSTPDAANNGVRLGLGFEFGSFNMNYAYTPYKYFGSSHMISFGVTLGNIFSPEAASDYYLHTHFEAGREFYYKKDFIRSREQFEEILAAYPDHNPSKEYLEKVNTSLEELKMRKEIRIEKWLKKAALSLSKRDYISARKNYNLVLRSQPENIQAKEGIEKVKHLLYELRQEKVRQENRDKIKKVWKTAMKYYRKGDYIKSKEKFQEILVTDPEHKETKRYLAEIDNQLTKIASVEVNKIYKQATEFYKAGKYNLALKYFEAVAIASPQRLDAKDFIAKCREKLTEEEERMKTDKVAAEQKKMQAEMEMVYTRALKMYEKGNLRAALESLYESKKVAQRYEFNDYMMNINKYISIIKSSLAEEHYKNGFAYYQKNKSDEAVEEYKKALKYDPNHTSAKVELERLSKDLSQQYYEQGMTYFSRGEMDMARQFFKKSLEYNPEKEESLRALQRIR